MEQGVSSAVLTGAVPLYLYKTTDNPDGGFNDETIKGLQDNVKENWIKFLDDFTIIFFASGNDTSLVSEPFRLYKRDIAAFASAKGTFDCIPAFSKTDFRADLDKFDIPTLVIHGDSDAVVPLEVSG